MSRARPRRRHQPGDGGIRDAAAGFACLGRGMLHVLHRPRLLWLGALPALATSVLLFVLFAMLIWASGPVAVFLTTWAAGWHPLALDILRTLLAAMLVLGGALLAVVMFGAVTLAVGAPCYERIAETVDRECGVGPPVPVAAATLARSLTDAVQTLGLSALVAVGVFLVSLVPALGQVAAPVVGAAAGGWLLTLELIQPGFERRGLGRLRDRRAWTKRYREMALGFGVPVYLCLLVPVLGVIVFPGAVAGATLLARTMRGEPAVPRDQG